MRISVTHSTVYRYREPARLGPHVIRLRPREDGSQRLIRYDLRVEPEPAGSAQGLDQDGNVVVQAWFDSGIRQLSVLSRLEVETLRQNPFDFRLPDPLLERLAASRPASLAVYSDPTAVPEPVRAFARLLADESGQSVMPFLTALNRRIYERTRHLIREEGSPYTSAKTLALGEGSCRDLAVLFCDGCRSVGLPARFVSGYERAAADERAYMHAWAEVYLPGGGWRGYDPSRCLAVADQHVPVAAALDPADAAPISGSHSSSGAAMDIDLRMDVSDSPDGPT